MTPTWDRPWHETPNIHPCTIRDFFALCEHDGYVVESWLAADDGGRRTPWRRARRLANLFGEQGLFLLRRVRAPRRIDGATAVAVRVRPAGRPGPRDLSGRIAAR